MCIRDRYAVTRTADRPAEWQDSNVFANITENGTYYLWAKDNVQRVSADADADGGEGTPDPGPEEIVIDTIDRSRPVMDDILHSAVDNAPAGMFGLSLIHICRRRTFPSYSFIIDS